MMLTSHSRRLNLRTCSEGELVLDMSLYSDGESVRAALVSAMGGVTLRYSDRKLESLNSKNTSTATHNVTVLLHCTSNRADR